MSSRWREFRGQRRPPPAPLRPNSCWLCGADVIWARLRPAKVKSGGRAFVPFPVERCEPGTGNVALTSGLFRDPASATTSPRAEIVTIGTSYRSHREHCTKLPPKTPKAPATAQQPRAHSADTFKKPFSRGGSR